MNQQWAADQNETNTILPDMNGREIYLAKLSDGTRVVIELD